MVDLPLEFQYTVRCELDTRFFTAANTLVSIEDFMELKNTRSDFKCRYGKGVKLASVCDVGAEQSYGLIVDYSPQMFYVNNMAIGE